MARSRHTFAFTLIELILVLVICTVMLALAAPSLKNWGEGQKLRNLSDQFLAATGYARTQAVAAAKPYSIVIDPKAMTYVVNVVDGETTKPVDGEFGQLTTLPPLYSIEKVSGGSTNTGTAGAAPAAAGDSPIMFYPDARTTPALVKITGPSGDSISVASANPAAPFEKVVPQ